MATPTTPEPSPLRLQVPGLGKQGHYTQSPRSYVGQTVKVPGTGQPQEDGCYPPPYDPTGHSGFLQLGKSVSQWFRPSLSSRLTRESGLEALRNCHIIYLTWEQREEHNRHGDSPLRTKTLPSYVDRNFHVCIRSRQWFPAGKLFAECQYLFGQLLPFGAICKKWLQLKEAEVNHLLHRGAYTLILESALGYVLAEIVF